jgi:glutathione S-transferase
MEPITIVIGNKNYSSWSLRGWLALSHTGAPFREVLVPLDRPDTRERILAVSPSGRVPAIVHGDITGWDSLAVGEYLAETFPDAHLWPEDRGARARARSVSAEMHSGFASLQADMPMNIKAHLPGMGRTQGSLRDIARVREIWQDCLSRAVAAKHAGPFLFGRFSLADAMFAPVVLRFRTYEVELDPRLREYCGAVLALPALEQWMAAGREEEWVEESAEYPRVRA